MHIHLLLNWYLMTNSSIDRKRLGAIIRITPLIGDLEVIFVDGQLAFRNEKPGCEEQAIDIYYSEICVREAFGFLDNATQKVLISGSASNKGQCSRRKSNVNSKSMLQMLDELLVALPG